MRKRPDGWYWVKIKHQRNEWVVAQYSYNENDTPQTPEWEGSWWINGYELVVKEHEITCFGNVPLVPPNNE